MTGVDMEQQMMLEARQLLERQLGERRGVGEASRYYPLDPERMSESSIEELALYNSILEEMRRLRDERDRLGAE